MAKAKGANVIGTCSSKEKAEIAKRRGCDFVIVTKSDDATDDDDDVWPQLPEMVRDIIRANTKDSIISSNYGPININDGAHVVYDSVGKASAMASLECLRPRGIAVLFGNASGPPPDLSPLLLSKLGSLGLTRPKLHDFIQTRSEVVSRSKAVFQMLQNRELEINIQHTIPFTRSGVIGGTKMLQGRKTIGKVLFDIRKGRQYQDAAESILLSRISPLGSKLSKLDSQYVPQTVDDAYDVQTLVNGATLLKGNTTMIGMKIAATSSVAQASVSVQEPFYGSLFSHSTFTTGAKISISDTRLGLQEGFLLIEPEFAVRMNSDTKTGVEYSPEEMKKILGGVLPSVEIATSGFAMPELESFKLLGAPTLISDNACHGVLVVGDELTRDDETFNDVLDSLDEQTCILKINGDTVADGCGNKVLGHPLNALCWLANALGRRGETLKKGDIISTGVCVDKLVLAQSQDSVTVCYGDLGEVTFDVTD